MKVLVLGSGAREHALAEALAPGADEVLVAPGNDGMRDVARPVPVPLHDLAALVDLAQREAIDLTVAGSEEPLVRGVWDVFDGAGLRLFGPSRAAAALEGSKVFAKHFMQRHRIPTAGFEVYEDFEEARRALAKRPLPVVVKADGLAAGKGVVVAATRDEAEASLHAMLVERRYGDAGSRVLLEETLQGPELSVFALSDGYSFRFLGCARDHKRAFDGDRGPNTGGMGAYAPVALDPGLQEEIEARIFGPTLAGLVDEGTPYRGFLYAGLMLTADGPQVLEFNCRLGDPEAQVLLPRLRTDLLRLLRAADRGDAGGAALEVDPGAAVAVVVASPGYPDLPQLGRVVHGLDAARATGARVYCAGVRARDGALVTSGGRICTVVGRGADVAAARQAAYAGVDCITIDGAFHRRDIGLRALEGEAWPSRASAS
jgi:phosphoribosylamine--glycine ligase